MSKWKCGICGSEFDNFQAQGFEGTIYCPLCYFKKLYKDTELEREKLQNQLQEKEHIIKEVREYITSYESISTIQGLNNLEVLNDGLVYKTIKEMTNRYLKVHDKILEILDKGE